MACIDIKKNDQDMYLKSSNTNNIDNNHSVYIVNGLDYLKSNKILCDVVLIAESMCCFFFNHIQSIFIYILKINLFL